MTWSFTGWNRLEPSPRTPDVTRALAAEVHDPLWFLARQWQLGELRGEDAASIAWAQLTTRSAIDAAWGLNHGQTERPLLADGDYPYMPLERALLEEMPDGKDISLAVELSQTFDAFLREDRVSAREEGDVTRDGRLRDLFRRHFPLPAASDDEAVEAFLDVCRVRSFDGVALFCKSVETDLWTFLDWRPSRAELGALGRFQAHVWAVHAGLQGGEPAAWRAQALRYEATVVMNSPDREVAALRVAPGADGTVDWMHWDTHPPAPFAVRRERRFIPGNLRFRGMPNARFWDFETAQTDFGRVRADRRDLGRLAVLDMALVHGNDWFLIPIPMAVGTACEIETLSVRDVFGGETQIQRAETYAQEWSMYSTNLVRGGTASFFHLPATAAFTLQQGITLEEVRFVRDEGANLAWAIEELVPDGLGQPRRSRERADALRRTSSANAQTSTPASSDAQPIAEYVLQTDVPAFWYPLVPERGADNRVNLRLGEFITSAQQTPDPDGRLLRLEGFVVTKDAVPEAGARVLRRRMASRWIDGSLHVWVQRVVMPSASDAVSGLRYDATQWRNDTEQHTPSET